MTPCTHSDKYMDSCDGTYFKSHPLLSTNTFAFQIQMYYDNFECTNPLGSEECIKVLS